MKKILLFVTLLTIVAFPQEHRFKGNVKVNKLEATAVNAQKITADSVLFLHLVGVDTSYAGLDSIQVYNAIALKADKNSPTFTGTVVLPSTTSIGNVSSTELGYLDNVTGNIQPQINAKLNATDTLSLSNRINAKASIAQLSAVKTLSFIQNDPDSATSFTILKTKVQITIDSVYALAQGDTSSIDFQIYYGVNRTSGTGIWASNQIANNITIGETFTGFANDIIPINNLIWISIPAITNLPTEFLCVIYYH